MIGRAIGRIYGVSLVFLAAMPWTVLGDDGSIEKKSPPKEPARAIAPFSAAQVGEHQSAWARHLGQLVETENSLKMTLVLLPPGEFRMGSSPAQIEEALRLLETVPRKAAGEDGRIQDEEGPAHRVVLTRPIRIARTETTIGQFRQFIEATRYLTETERFGGGNSKKTDEADPVKRNAIWRTPGYPVTDECPVTQITWNDMIAFCNWLSVNEGRRAAYRQDENKDWRRDVASGGYRLPTEAEWEYACRAGTTTHWSFGDDIRELDRHAWFNRTAEAGRRIGARPVGSLRANPFGLYDMHGNAWERCEDFLEPAWYRKSPELDPTGPAKGTNRMARGGGWHYFDLHTRSAYRNNYSPTARTGNIGFRVVLSP